MEHFFQLFAESNKRSARVRFTGFRERVATTNAPTLDSNLSLLTSDVGSIAIGLLGFLLLLIGRFFFFDDGDASNIGYQTRVNLLAVFAVGSILLNGLTKLDVESVVSEPVVLVGAEVIQEPVIAVTLPGDDNNVLDDTKTTAIKTMKWTLSAVLAATPACTVVLLSNKKNANGNNKDDDDDSNMFWMPIAAAGAVPTREVEKLVVPRKTPILDRFLKERSQETYLPTLQALPGKMEFTYLPTNTQAALLLPAPELGVLVLGSNQAKSFTPRDIAWCQTVIKQLRPL